MVQCYIGDVGENFRVVTLSGNKKIRYLMRKGNQKTTKKKGNRERANIYQHPVETGEGNGKGPK